MQMFYHRLTVINFFFQDVVESQDEKWIANFPNCVINTPVPWSIRRLLYAVAAKYGENIKIIISDEGYAMRDDIQPFNDYERADYHKSYINEVLKG